MPYLSDSARMNITNLTMVALGQGKTKGAVTRCEGIGWTLSALEDIYDAAIAMFDGNKLRQCKGVISLYIYSSTIQEFVSSDTSM